MTKLNSEIMKELNAESQRMSSDENYDRLQIKNGNPLHNYQKKIKSVAPVQKRQVKNGEFKLVTSGGQGGWDVRIRYENGEEQLLVGSFPYTLAQAGAAAESARRELK